MTRAVRQPAWQVWATASTAGRGIILTVAVIVGVTALAAFFAAVVYLVLAAYAALRFAPVP